MGVIQSPTHDPDHQNGLRLEERAALDAPEVRPDALLERSEHLLTVVTELFNFITTFVDELRNAAAQGHSATRPADKRSASGDTFPPQVDAFPASVDNQKKKKVGARQTTAERVIGMINPAAWRAQRRTDLLKRVKRWTYGRKIQLCAGLRANVVSVSDAILAHGLTQDEIGRWMEAYDKRDFDALRVGYCKKRRAA